MKPRGDQCWFIPLQRVCKVRHIQVRLAGPPLTVRSQRDLKELRTLGKLRRLARHDAGHRLSCPAARRARHVRIAANYYLPRLVSDTVYLLFAHLTPGAYPNSWHVSQTW